MSEKIEGTLVLDGLMEGKLPEAPDVQGHLRDWVRFAASLGLRFSLEVEGNSWSLLADNHPASAGRPGADPAQVIADALEQLLRVFPPDLRRRIFSTLRSIEYRKGIEVRTLYVVGPDGSIAPRQETVEAPTRAAPQPMSLRQKMRLAALGLGAAVAIVALSALFVDYGKLLSSIADAIRPFNVEKLEVDAEAFKDYFTVEKKEARDQGREVVLTLRRTGAFPLKEADVQALAEQRAKSFSALLALEAVVRGYARCEFFGPKKEYLGFTFVRIRGLAESETIEAPLPIAGRRGLQRIVLTD